MYSVDATVMRPASEIIEWLQPFYNLVVGAKWIAADKGEKEAALNLLATYSDAYKTGKKFPAETVRNQRAIIDKLGAGISGYGPELTVPLFRAMNAQMDTAPATTPDKPKATPKATPKVPVFYPDKPLPIADIHPSLQQAYKTVMDSKITANEKQAFLQWLTSISQNIKSGNKYSDDYVADQKKSITRQIDALPYWEKNKQAQSLKAMIFSAMDALRETIKDTANFSKYALPALGVLAALGLLYIGYSYVKAAASVPQTIMNIKR
jgi:hypothetical protein